MFPVLQALLNVFRRAHGEQQGITHQVTVSERQDVRAVVYAHTHDGRTLTQKDTTDWSGWFGS